MSDESKEALVADEQIARYKPNRNEFVWLSDPERKSEEPELALIINRATMEQKRDHISKVALALTAKGAKYEIHNFDSWIEDPDIYLAISGEEVVFVSGENIVGPCVKEG